MPGLSRKWWKAYWQLTKSKLPEANGNAALSPCTQARSGILRRAWRNIPSDPSRPTNLAFGVKPRLAICWLPVPHAMSSSVRLAARTPGQKRYELGIGRFLAMRRAVVEFCDSVVIDARRSLHPGPSQDGH